MPDAQVCNLQDSCLCPISVLQILFYSLLQHKGAPAERSLDPNRASGVFQTAGGGDSGCRSGCRLHGNHPDPPQGEAAMGCEGGLQCHR